MTTERAGRQNALGPSAGGPALLAFGTALLLAAALAATGCTDISKEVYTLNPDGTGKVQVQLVQQVDSPMDSPIQFGSGPGKSNEEKARKRVRKILDTSEGVEAWRDVTYKVAEIDGKAHVLVEGTAFFRDLAKLDFAEQDHPCRARWVTKTDGRAALSVMPAKDENDSNAEEDEKQPEPGEIDHPMVKRLAQARGWQGLRIYQGMLEGMYQEMVFHLPGPIAKPGEFEKTAPRTLSFVFDGHEAALAIGKLCKKDIDGLIRTADEMKLKDIRSVDANALSKLLGFRISATAEITGAHKPRFDFEKEVAEAKATRRQMLRKLGLTDSTPDH